MHGIVDLSIRNHSLAVQRWQQPLKTQIGEKRFTAAGDAFVKLRERVEETASASQFPGVDIAPTSDNQI